MVVVAVVVEREAEAEASWIKSSQAMQSKWRFWWGDAEDDSSSS